MPTTAPAPATVAAKLPPGEQAEILLTVARNPHPRLALPTIASNHDLSLADLQTFLQRHGYPNKDALTAAARRIAGTPAPTTMATATTTPTVVASPTPMPHPTSIPGAPGKREPFITALPAGAMFADTTYQRELDTNRVTRMAAAYDPALVGIIEVSERRHDDGSLAGYAILDGQHRWALVKDVYFAYDTDQLEPHLACRVHTGLTIDEEATLYHRLNTTRKQLTGWDRWKARRSAGDPTVIAIEETATAAGYTISYRSGTRGHITATNACEIVYQLGGRQLLAEVLGIIHAAWRDDPDAGATGIIQGLGHVLTNYDRDELHIDRLVEALSGIVPRQLNARAAAGREIHKGTIDKLTAHVIVEQYNQLRRAGQIPAFFARVKPLSPNKGTKRAAEVARAAAIRKWALEQGLLASESSKVTQAIRDAYDAAHAEDDQ